MTSKVASGSNIITIGINTRQSPCPVASSLRLKVGLLRVLRPPLLLPCSSARSRKLVTIDGMMLHVPFKNSGFPTPKAHLPTPKIL